MDLGIIILSGGEEGTVYRGPSATWNRYEIQDSLHQSQFSVMEICTLTSSWLVVMIICGMTDY